MKRGLKSCAIAITVAAVLASCTKKDVPGAGNTNTGTVTDTIASLKAAAAFPVGFAIENNLFMKNRAYHDTVVSEGSSVTFGNEMKYGSIVQSDGSFKFNTADALVNAVSASGLTVYGHVLGWYQQQNDSYLKTYAGINSASGPNLLSNAGFEDGLNGWSTYNSGNPSGTATITTGSGADEVHSGNSALKVINPTAYPGNQWRVQVSSAPFATTPAQQYVISFWVKAATAGGSMRLSTGPTNAQYEADQNIGTSWQQLSWTITASLSSTTFLFDMGQAANTYYIDDVSVSQVSSGGAGPAVAAKLDTALNNWITTIVSRYKGKVKAWDVVNELFTESGTIRNNSNTSATGAGVFIWSNYLGGDFALKAFQYAQAADPNALFFINDYNLESNNTKLDSLIAFVKSISARGAKVDGIGTQMHMSIATPYAGIDNMFQKLAATGLKVRISELDIRMNPNDAPGFTPTADLLATQASMYRYVVNAYFRNVPAAQRYGITFWGVDDATSWIVTALRKVDYPLLYDQNYARKPAFTAVLQALKDNK